LLLPMIAITPLFSLPDHYFDIIALRHIAFSLLTPALISSLFIFSMHTCRLAFCSFR